jgi:DNA/RNA-binding protein KIN17
MQRLIAEQEAAKAKAEAKRLQAGVAAAATAAAARRDDWLCTGIVVKVLNKKVGGGAYYKRKGAVVKVEDTYIAHVRMLEGGDVLRVDQADLETVIPTAGGEVAVVNGLHRGACAELAELHTDKFCADVRLLTGPAAGTLVRGIEYEDICRLADA